MIRYYGLAASALLLAACSSTPVAQVQPIDGVISGQCHLDAVRGVVGLAASDATLERARVDSDSLQVQVHRNVREQAGPTASGTVDPAAGAAHQGGERLTVETGRRNNITAVYCG